MSENLLTYSLMLMVTITVLFLLYLNYKIRLKEIKIERNYRAMDVYNEKLFRLLDKILFALPGEVFIPHADEENQSFEVQELVNEYLETILDIYDTCGTYCCNSHFPEEQLKEEFGKYISFLKKDKTLNEVIKAQPGYYKGIEYLIKTCS